MTGRRVAGAAVLATAGTLVLFWMTSIPAGVPGEWIWERIDAGPDILPDLLLGLTTSAVAGAAYLVLAWLGSRRLELAGRSERAAWLITLAAAAFGWLSVLQETPPPPWGQTRAAWVLYYPGPSGYFTRAREITSVREFLAGYPALMAEGDVLHTGTHPPGLFLLHYGLLELCRSDPGLTDLLHATEPASVAAGFDLIRTSSIQSGQTLHDAERAALWLAALLTQAAAAGTVLAQYLLLRQTSLPPAASWRAVCFWPLIPAVGMFLPKSDVLYPLVGTLFLWLWWSGCRNRSGWRMFAAGLVMAVGMFLSLAMLPVAFLGVLLAVGSLLFLPETDAGVLHEGDLVAKQPADGSPPALVNTWKSRWPAFLLLAGAAAAGWLLPLIGLAIWPGISLPEIWLSNLQNHAGFYDQFPRTWWKWLLVNPLELALAAGLPLFLLAVQGAGQVLRNRSLRWSPAGIVAGSSLVTWCLLWLSSRNMGEAARLWIFLLPWLVWVAGRSVLATGPQGNSGSPNSGDELSGNVLRSTRRLWLLVLACQAICCVGTAARLTGFQFG